MIKEVGHLLQGDQETGTALLCNGPHLPVGIRPRSLVPNLTRHGSGMGGALYKPSANDQCIDPVGVGMDNNFLVIC